MPKKSFKRPTTSFKELSSFRERVYRVVRKIPKGKIFSYSEVAKIAGSPRAWRVVGNILNKNKNPKILCHRVVRSDGKIGGYNRGAEKKIALLKKEGVKVEGDKIIF